MPSVRGDRVARLGGFVGRERAARGLLALEAERPVGLHERVYVARALVDDRGFAVPKVTLDGVVIREAVRAVYLNRHRSGLLAPNGGLPLRERGRAPIRSALVLEPSRAQP